jgi:hypothetical protein
VDGHRLAVTPGLLKPTGARPRVLDRAALTGIIFAWRNGIH